MLHAAVPRYEWRQGPNLVMLVRVDRWTGRALLGRFDGTWWKPLDEIAAERARPLGIVNFEPLQPYDLSGIVQPATPSKVQPKSKTEPDAISEARKLLNEK